MPETNAIMPAASDVIERIEEIERSIKKSKKESVKFLNTDNTWNKQGIMDAFDESEDRMVYCSASKIPLFYTDKNGRKWVLESHGFCVENGKPYHVSHLRMSEDVSHSHYPIVYSGCYSREEYAKPLTALELSDIRKKYGI